MSFVGNPDVTTTAAPPPPPPPPPPVSAHLPATRFNTVQSTASTRPQIGSSDTTYEPPAAIQNAMLTKDKKPFTYTPGMGGKLDLSQIRSPRMARRVAKNANDEGIEGPPKAALDIKAAPATPSNLFVQPQVAVPVFPANIPPQPQHVNKMPPQQPTVNRTLSNVMDKQVEPSRNLTKAEVNIAPITITSSQSGTPESPNTPTQITLTKAPTPWLQNKNKTQDDLPEWAKRANINKMASDDSSDNVSSQSSPQEARNGAQAIQQNNQPPQYQCQQTSPPSCQQARQQQRQNTDHERVIPIRIEDRPSVFDAKRDFGHHQYIHPPAHRQQRWGQTPGQYTPDNQAETRVVVTPSQSQPTATYIIPVVVEGDVKRTLPSDCANNAIGRTPKVSVYHRDSVAAQQHDNASPVQSRSFRVLQKITDTDTPNDVATEQIRKMQLSEDERVLMNKFKEQVDHEIYLHQEEDPRYRGAAIPSRAFRFLQNITDSSESADTCATPQNNVASRRQNRNSKSFEETQANLPPSEQQVQEPKKYMGSAIPSRSFRLLQAMTASENIATQENRQADYTCRTETNLPGNQQGVFLPRHSLPIWYPDGWCGYYAAQCNSIPNELRANTLFFPPYAYIRYLNDSACEPLYRIYHQHPFGQSLVGYDSEAAFNDLRETHGDVSSHDENFTENAAINHLDAHWIGAQNPKNFIGNGTVPEKDSIITTMNIIEEERNSQEIPKDIAGTIVCNSTNKFTKTFGLHINVPNYTYIDTSDSSASSDSTSSDSTSNNANCFEHASDSCRRNSNRSDVDTASDDTMSDDNSNEYDVAYFADSIGKLEADSQKHALAPVECTIGGEKLRNHLDYKNNPNLHHTFQQDITSETSNERGSVQSRNSAIEEDAQRRESDTSEELTDDVKTTMVSVCLPLRFKFFLSENNEDITTVTVGDSKVKTEKAYDVKDERTYKSDQTDDVYVNFHVGNDTSVDFTVQRYISGNECDGTTVKDVKAINGRDTVIPLVDFTLRKNTTVDDITSDEHIDADRADSVKSSSNETDDYTRSESVMGNSLLIPHKESCSRYPKEACQTVHRDPREDTDDEDSGVTSDISRMISEVDTDSECASSRNRKKYQRTQTHSRLFRFLNEDSDCLNTSDSSKKNYLTLPLNSRYAFNYDDSYCSNYSSGLTSPEYSPIHEQPSRRFHDVKFDHPSSRLERPSYKDDAYFQTWKVAKSSPFHEHDVVPSLAFKTLDSKVPSWTYKVNVLCPRVKSTKSVPQNPLVRRIAQSSQIDKFNDPSIVTPPIPTSLIQTDYC